MATPRSKIVAILIEVSCSIIPIKSRFLALVAHRPLTEVFGIETKNYTKRGEVGSSADSRKTKGAYSRLGKFLRWRRRPVRAAAAVAAVVVLHEAPPSESMPGACVPAGAYGEKTAVVVVVAVYV